MKHVFTWLALSLLLASPGYAATAQDTTATKTQLVDEYFSYIPMKKIVEETVLELSKRVPAEKRQQFIDTMTQRMRVEVLEHAARESLARHLTVSELRLFVEFIKRPEARSAMDKMKYYMSDLMPVMQQEMMRAMQAPPPPAK
jgi:ATP-dependent DNA ligase